MSFKPYRLREHGVSCNLQGFRRAGASMSAEEAHHRLGPRKGKLSGKR